MREETPWQVGKNDPYVTVTLAGHTLRTTTIDGGGAAPVWGGGEQGIDGDDDARGEKLVFDVGPSGLPGSMLVCCMDEDVVDADDFIGECEIPLSTQAQEGWHTLASEDGSATGRVYLRVERRRPRDESEARCSYDACRCAVCSVRTR